MYLCGSVSSVSAKQPRVHIHKVIDAIALDRAKRRISSVLNTFMENMCIRTVLDCGSH